MKRGDLHACSFVQRARVCAHAYAQGRSLHTLLLLRFFGVGATQRGFLPAVVAFVAKADRVAIVDPKRLHARLVVGQIDLPHRGVEVDAAYDVHTTGGGSNRSQLGGICKPCERAKLILS